MIVLAWLIELGFRRSKLREALLTLKRIKTGYRSVILYIVMLYGLRMPLCPP